MSYIQTVLNSVDMRRKIFNFKSQNIKTTTQNNFNLVIEELNKCFENLLDNTAEMNEGEPCNDYVEFDWIMRQDLYFTAFYWLMDEINDIKVET
jgi:ERCC4-related helicase